VKGSLFAAHVFCVLFIFLLLIGIVIWNFPEVAVAQSVVPDDVQHDSPGRILQQGNPSISMWNWRSSTLPSATRITAS
jgi:hypothetical protein